MPCLFQGRDVALVLPSECFLGRAGGGICGTPLQSPCTTQGLHATPMIWWGFRSFLKGHVWAFAPGFVTHRQLSYSHAIALQEVLLPLMPSGTL